MDQVMLCEKAAPDAFPAGWSLVEIADEETDYFAIRGRCHQLAEQIASNGDERLSANLELIGHMCGMMLQESEPGEPFRPYVVMKDGARSATLDDLGANHLRVLEAALSRVSNSAVLARAYDILWIKVRPTKREFAEKAIENYIALAAKLRQGGFDNIVYASSYLKRAIQLWRSVGSDPAIRSQIETEIEACMMLSQAEPVNFIRHRFYELIPDVFELADVTKWADLGNTLVDESLKQKAYEKARSYLESLREIYRTTKDTAKASAARDRHADLFVQEARDMRADGAAAMLLQDRYNKAIEACRNTPGKSELAKQLHAELVEIQKAIPGGLKRASTEVDMQPAVEETLAAMRKEPFAGALRIIAEKAYPSKKSKLLAEGEEFMKRHPLQSIIGMTILDEKGKVIAYRPGRGSTPEEEAAASRAQAAQHMGMRFELSGFVIKWAQRELNHRFDMDESAIDSLLYPNPFVPMSRRAQFKRGIITGLRGDWISSVSILTPQLENSLRHIMQIAGHNMTSLDSDGIQQEKDLNAFIYGPELGAIIGEDMQFQLQVLLCDKTGPNLRNNVAHGLLTDSAALSSTGAFLWACTLLLCIEFYSRYYAENVAPNAAEPAENQALPE